MAIFFAAPGLVVGKARPMAGITQTEACAVPTHTSSSAAVKVMTARPAAVRRPGRAVRVRVLGGACGDRWVVRFMRAPRAKTALVVSAGTRSS